MTGAVCIRTYLAREAAEIDRAFLESCGFRVWIEADDCGGMQPFLVYGTGGVRLLVVEEQAGEALELLESIPGTHPPG